MSEQQFLLPAVPIPVDSESEPLSAAFPDTVLAATHPPASNPVQHSVHSLVPVRAYLAGQLFLDLNQSAAASRAKVLIFSAVLTASKTAWQLLPAGGVVRLCPLKSLQYPATALNFPVQPVNFARLLPVYSET